jgi:preprotein translocase subunit SecY
MAGVIPVIFAAAIGFRPRSASSSADAGLREQPLHALELELFLEATLIVIFTYFYTAVQFNPVDQADNLRKYGATSPGSDPGRRRRSTSTACSRG